LTVRFPIRAAALTARETRATGLGPANYAPSIAVVTNAYQLHLRK
jgi:hypothetical protein